MKRWLLSTSIAQITFVVDDVLARQMEKLGSCFDSFESAREYLIQREQNKIEAATIEIIRAKKAIEKAKKMVPPDVEMTA